VSIRHTAFGAAETGLLCFLIVMAIAPIRQPSLSCWLGLLFSVAFWSSYSSWPSSPLWELARFLRLSLITFNIILNALSVVQVVNPLSSAYHYIFILLFNLYLCIFNLHCDLSGQCVQRVFDPFYFPIDPYIVSLSTFLHPKFLLGLCSAQSCYCSNPVCLHTLFAFFAIMAS